MKNSGSTLFSNKIALRGFTIFELVVVIVLLGILFAAVISTIDPGQRAKKIRDEKQKINAQELLGGIKTFYDKENKYPWKSPDTSLSWTEGASLPLAEMISREALPAGFPNEDFIKTQDPAGKIYVGKTAGTAPVWACFIPLARANRIDIIKLHNLKTGDLVGGDTPNECETPPDWEHTFCYVCINK